MSKIYPSEPKLHDDPALKEKASVEEEDHCMLTVWKRSSMSFQGTDGFTVFDHHGRLVFRVDNYSRNHRSVTVVLMDGHGNPLLSLKPQILSMQYQWSAYREEEGYGKKKKKRRKLFSMRSTSGFLNGGKDKAEVFMRSSSGRIPDFRIEGSFRSRNCKITDANGEVVAKIARKRTMNSTVLLSDDVFSLIIRPGYSSAVVMAFVIILDRIASKPYTPVLCS